MCGLAFGGGGYYLGMFVICGVIIWGGLKYFGIQQGREEAPQGGRDAENSQFLQ